MELLNFPRVRGTGLTVNDAVGALGTVGEIVAERRTLLDKPRLPRLTVALIELPATTLPATGFTAMVKLPTTVMDKTTECLRVPLMPVTVTR